MGAVSVLYGFSTVFSIVIRVMYSYSYSDGKSEDFIGIDSG